MTMQETTEPADIIPQCLMPLAEAKRWVVWGWENRTDKHGNVKPTKPPRKAFGGVRGGYAQNDKPETWATLAEAQNAMQSPNVAGIGLQLLELRGVAALDLDDVRNDAGELLPWARDLIARCGSYAEWTPSGNGARILGLVPKNYQSIHKKRAHDEGGEYEIYANLETGRYITVSGDRIDGTPDKLVDIQEAVERLNNLNQQEQEQEPTAKFDFGAMPGWVRTYVEHGGSGDRSGDFQSIVNALRPRGWTFEAILKLLQDNPQGPAAKYIEGDRLEAELRRSWERAKPAGAATSDGAPRPNAPDEMPELNQDALALDMGAAEWDQDARHVASWGKWLFWTGTHWQADDRLDHMTRTRVYLRHRAEQITLWAERKGRAMIEADATKGEVEAAKLEVWAKDQSRTLRHKNTVAAIESLARSNQASVAGADDFDRDRMLLGTPGGTVDLRTGQLSEAQRGDMITKQTTTAPAPAGAVPHRWLEFMAQIFNDDQDIIAFMQRAAGYALTGMTTEHKLLFFYGTGRNGKSVFIDTLFDIWGDYARKAASATFLNSQTERHPTDLAGLQGARLVAGSELPKGKTWDESVIKDLTGGDKMTARFMRGDYFDFDPQLTLMIAGNNQPSFRGVDEAIRARVVLVPFTVTIPAEKRVKGLSDILQAEEAPAILRWAIDGALEWQKRGLDVPPVIEAASAEYFDDEDTMGQFLTDETRGDATGFVTTTDLHQRFVQWSDMQGLNSWTLRTLQKEMKGRGYQDLRRNHGRGFVGIKLR